MVTRRTHLGVARATRLARVGLGAAFAVVAGSIATACSLGLDASLLNPSPAIDGGAPADARVEASDGGPGDAPIADASSPSGARCSVDADCVLPDAGACVQSAQCDPTWHVCVFDVCDAGACKASSCDATTRACSSPSPYGFDVGRFTVTYGGVGGRTIASSIAAVHPFVFVVTTNGVAAYDVADPTAATPPIVPVEGVPFLPVAAVAVGRRVVFVGRIQGSGPTYHQAIAWADVPGDPLATSLTAQAAWVATTENGIDGVFTNGSDGAYVVYSPHLLPTANVHPPLADSTLAAAETSGLPQGSDIVASSGTRVVGYRYDDTTGYPNFTLVTGAGTSLAQAAPEQTISDYGTVDDQEAFATGGDGSLLWTSALLDTSNTNDTVTSARLTWALADAGATTIDTRTYVDLETYGPDTCTTVVAPPAWIDANTALGLAAAAEDTTTTSVQVVTRAPPALEPGKRSVLAIDPGSVGVASSNGFAYVLAEDDPKNATASVYVFAPGCSDGD